MERPFFSICIPCFNHGGYIAETIQSVLDQNFQDFEIIVADNASTDNSKEVVLGIQDPRIRLIENKYNIGFAPNLQKVTSEANGRYMNLLSSDDVMNPGALRTYHEIINNNPNGLGIVLMSQAWIIDSKGKKTAYITKRPHRFAPVRVQMPQENEITKHPLFEEFKGFDVFANCMEIFDTAGVFCSVVYSRGLWENVEGYNSTMLVKPDAHFIHKVLKLNPAVYFVNRPLYSYRVHEMGQARQESKNALLKSQVDRYNFLMQWSHAFLEGTGITPDHQRNFFINRELNTALVNLSNGRWLLALRLLFFALATYPRHTMRSIKSWALIILLLTGPLGWGLLQVVKLFRKRQSQKL